MRPLEECRLPQRLPRHRTYIADKNPQEDQKQGKQPQHSNNKLLEKILKWIIYYIFLGNHPIDHWLTLQHIDQGMIRFLILQLCA